MQLRFPLKVRIYVWIVTSAAVVLLIASLLWFPRSTLTEGDWLLAIAFFGFVGLAYLHPLQLTQELKVQVETAAVFASAILLPPPVAMLISAAGTCMGIGLRRRPFYKVLFNTSQTGLYAGLGSLTYHILSSLQLPASIPGALAPVIAIMMTALVCYFSNTLLVTAAVGLQRGMNPFGIWLAHWQQDILEHVALFLLGLLTVLVVGEHPWAILLSALPVVIVYISLERSLHLQTQTREALEALADVVDMRDPYTFAHSRRVAEYAYELARTMKLAPQQVELITSAARVHDLGKIGIGEILNKPGRLTDAEWQKMREHPRLGAQIVSRFPLYQEGQELILHHHEWMDGQGYPDSLYGEQVSLGARILAVADALDAMTSDRPYREALPLDVVRREFEKGAGSQWDAGVVKQLLRLLPDGRITEDTPPAFVELATRLAGDNVRTV